jgi:hypothetical protein
MLREFEAPDMTTPAISLLAGATATVMFSALAGMREAVVAANERTAEEWMHAAHVMTEAYQREVELRRSDRHHIDDLERQLAENLNRP